MQELYEDKKNLRPYQEVAVERSMALLAEGKKSLLIMATGTGKTIVFSEIIRRMKDRRSLVIAHREELIDQAIDKISKQTGYRPGKEKAHEAADLQDRVVVGSVQSMQNSRLARWPRAHFGLVVIDEAHHTTAKSYRNLIGHFEASNLLGVTATPDRADSKQLGEIYTDIAFQYPLHQAIKDGYLCRIVGRRVRDFNINLSDLKIVAGDFQEGDLAKVLGEYIAPLAHSIKEETHDRKTLVFMPNVDSSRLMSDTLVALGLKSAWISGGTDTNERRDILYRFSRGMITHVVSCNVLLEGFDEPSVDAIVMLRPTGSRAIYAQAVGRGTRLHPGKDHLRLVEFTFNSDRLKLVTAYELFSSQGLGERVQAHARKKGEGQVEEDFMANMEEAHDSIYKLDSIIERLPVKSYGFIEFDPMAFSDLLGVDLSGEFDIHYKGRKLEGPITEKQRDLLARYNISGLDNLDKAQASAMISAIFDKGFQPIVGMATDKQLSYLRRLGLPIRDDAVTKAQASALITIMGHR